jgi:ABC-2 type transport system ATP-binding protein
MPAGDPPALVVSALAKRYGRHPALRGVDLDVRAGEIHGLLGPNGAGKTTLMRVVLGLVEADAGSVRIFGEPASGSLGPPPPTVAGFVDAPRFYPYLSGRRNLRLLARLDGAGDATERIARALEQVGLAADADRPFAGYSAGMQQRLALAAALLRSPKLLLLDEPTSSLDPAGARDLRALVRRLSAGGVAVLLSSHDLAEVRDLCTTTTILRRGTVAFAGTFDELGARAPDALHRLRTSDDAGALAVASALERTHATAAADGQGLDVRAGESERDAFVLALGREGIAVRSLESHDRSLEDLFLQLTEGGEEPGPPAIPPPERRHLRVTHGPWTAAGSLAVVRTELTKLAAQAKTWVALAACVLGSFAFAIAMATQSALPEDTLFGRAARSSGFAIPLVVLGFAAAWALPVLAALVGGDVFSAEDRHGTWPTVLTRSRSRSEIFTGKVAVALGFAAVAVLALAAASLTAGVLVIGRQPLLGLSGAELRPDRALEMTAGAWLTAVPPTLAFAAVAVLASIVTRSSVAGVGLPVLLGFGMQLASFLNGPALARRLLLTSAFDAWHGLFLDPAVVTAATRSVALSGAYLALGLAAARLAFSPRVPASTVFGAIAALALAALAARGPSGEVTKARIEGALTQTFANLVSVQVDALGAPPVEPASLHAFADCHKTSATKEARGPGDWTCDLTWYVPARHSSVHDRYDVGVTPDGCYVATADGAEAHVGGPTLTKRDGGVTRNLLYAFEGCFDTTAP